MMEMNLKRFNAEFVNELPIRKILLLSNGKQAKKTL